MPTRPNSPSTASARGREDDPEFDRDCFSPDGKSFEPDPVAAATSPLVCSLPAERIPALRAARALDPHRQRQLLHGDDVSRAALPSTMQPSNIHDATWGALSAVYGGAFHPSAEGHAAMADAALPAVRDVLGLKAPPRGDRAAAAAAAIGASESNQFLVASFRACAGFQQENC